MALGFQHWRKNEHPPNQEGVKLTRTQRERKVSLKHSSLLHTHPWGGGGRGVTRELPSL